MTYQENLNQLSKEIYDVAVNGGENKIEWLNNCAKIVVEKLNKIFELGYEHGFSNALMGSVPVQSCLDLQKQFGLVPQPKIKECSKCGLPIVPPEYICPICNF